MNRWIILSWAINHKQTGMRNYQLDKETVMAITEDYMLITPQMREDFQKRSFVADFRADLIKQRQMYTNGKVRETKS